MSSLAVAQRNSTALNLLLCRNPSETNAPSRIHKAAGHHGGAYLTLHGTRRIHQHKSKSCSHAPTDEQGVPRPSRANQLRQRKPTRETDCSVDQSGLTWRSIANG